MSTPFPALYCDGQTLRSHRVEVQFAADGSLQFAGGTASGSVPLAAVKVSPRLGRVPRFLHLPGAAVLEIADDPAFDAALSSALTPHRVERAVHWLESRAAIAAASTLILAAAVVVTVWLGLPRLARRAAYAVPESIESQAGRVGYQVFARNFAASELSYVQQRRVQRQLTRLQAARAFHVKPVLAFVHMRVPNAFALPGGIIVVTDELVELAQNDEEIAAVLAHEMGHVEKRHGLQSVLRSSAALIVVSTVTGDLSTLTTFSGTLPFILLQYGYAREFEHEADDYAIGLLHDAHIDPVNLARILQRLEGARPKTGADFSYLSSHPATEERIKFVQSFTPTRLALPEAAQPDKRPVASWNMPKSPVDQPPAVLFQPSLQYPDDMRRANITGEVTVEFIVDDKGIVRNAAVITSSRKEFEKPALSAINAWFFRPGFRNGRPVNTRMQQTITFTLSDEDSASPPAAPTPGR